MKEYIIRTKEPIEYCAKCPMRHKQGSAWCQYLMKWTPDEEEKERLEGCPLVEVPPHGRLIDADVIGNWLREQHVFSMPTTCKIDSIIKNAPTVIEASKERE